MSNHPTAPLWRRIAALGYDSLLIGAILFVSIGALLLIYQMTNLPMVEINDMERPPQWFSIWVLRPICFLLIVGFYALFWRKGGQTLGMRAWRIKAESLNQRPVTFWQALIRTSAGLLTIGVGFLFMFFNKNRASLQDIASQTRTVLVPKTKK